MKKLKNSGSGDLFGNIDTSEAGVLRRFMDEFFPFSDFKKIGFFTKEMKGNYEAQAKMICDVFGFKTVYEYRATEIRGHISYAEGKRPPGEPFVTVFPSIYDSPPTE